MNGEECLLKFNAIPFIEARYHIHTGCNGVIYLTGNKRELGYILAHKLTDDIEKEVKYYKPDLQSLEKIFGKNITDLEIIDDLKQIDEDTIVIIDSKTFKSKKKINDLPQFILITQSQKLDFIKGKYVLLKINTRDRFLNDIEVYNEGKRIRVIL